jgi:hypothetical protein
MGLELILALPVDPNSYYEIPELSSVSASVADRPARFSAVAGARNGIPLLRSNCPTTLMRLPSVANRLLAPL